VLWHSALDSAVTATPEGLGSATTCAHGVCSVKSWL
jgi:hypothetical protein